MSDRESDQEQVQATTQLESPNGVLSIEETATKIGELDLEQQPRCPTIEQVPEVSEEDVTEEQKVINTQENENEEEEDDFGSFSDASFDDFEESTALPTTSIQNTSRFPQSAFDNQDELFQKLTELTSSAFPKTLPNHEIPSNTSILNERSEHLLERLIALPYLKPYNWNKSSLRRKLLQTLGLPDDVVHKVRKNTFDADDYPVKTVEELGITEEERKKLLNESEVTLNDILENLESAETLSVLDNESLKLISARLENELQTVETLLSCWKDEELKLQEDNKTFESVVENLVGHTQRLRREETMKSLKKEKEKNRLSVIFKKKSKK